MGLVFCLLSAAGFGLMAVFAKLAYAEGVTVDALLVVRFGLAGVVLVAVSASRGALRALTFRAVVTGLAMGAFGYAAQAGLYLAAVARIDASQVALVFCVYPVVVMIAAVALGRDQASRRRVIALLAASWGIVLLLGGGAGAGGGFDSVGAALALGSALVYSAYILIGDRVVDDVPPLPMAALVCVGAFITCSIVSLLLGGPRQLPSLPALGWLTALAMISTVGAILLFFAGMARVGPTVASLLSSIEPVVTVASAAIVFGEGLSAAQAFGGAFVLAAVAVVQWPGRVRPTDGEHELSTPSRQTQPDSADTRPAMALSGRREAADCLH